MAREYTTVVGSGTIPHLATAPALNITEGTFPVPSQRDQLRTRTATGAVITNPEDFSVSMGLRQQAITVGTSATLLPTAPLEYRRALVIHNNAAITIYLGQSDVTSSNGFPLLAGEKVAFDIGGTPNVNVYGIVASASADVRILELA